VQIPRCYWDLACRFLSILRSARLFQQCATAAQVCFSRVPRPLQRPQTAQNCGSLTPTSRPKLWLLRPQTAQNCGSYSVCHAHKSHKPPKTVAPTHKPPKTVAPTQTAQNCNSYSSKPPKTVAHTVYTSRPKLWLLQFWYIIFIPVTRRVKAPTLPCFYTRYS